jgi:hypothetical protein
MQPFARTIDAAKKYVVSSTVHRVDWNAELVRGDLIEAVEQLKRQPGKGLFVGGVTLPLAFGAGGADRRVTSSSCTQARRPWADVVRRLSKPVDLRLVSREELGSGVVAMRFVPQR